MPVENGLDSAERRLWALLLDTVDEHVDPLVIEGNQSGDLLALRKRRRVGPARILVAGLAEPYRPVPCLPFVRAVGDLVRGFEQVETYIGLRQVIARRQSRLIEDPRAARVSNCHTVELDPDVPG